MQVVDNKALLLRLRDPKKVTSVIPKSKYKRAFSDTYTIRLDGEARTDEAPEDYF